MTDTGQTMDLLTEWRRLTERETHAILAGDWKGVSDQQSRKQQLMQEIAQLKASARTADSARASGLEGRSLDSLVAELMTLEARNRDLLSTQHQNAQVELHRLNRTARNLQGVRRAYGRNGVHQWQSYS